MGPLNIPRLPADTESFFISFIDVHSRFSYVAPFDLRSKTAEFVTRFPDRIKEEFGRASTWFISDNAGKYMSDVVTKIIGNMDVQHVPIINIIMASPSVIMELL